MPTTGQQQPVSEAVQSSGKRPLHQAEVHYVVDSIADAMPYLDAIKRQWRSASGPERAPVAW